MQHVPRRAPESNVDLAARRSSSPATHGGPMKVVVVASGRLEAIDVANLDDADLVIAADGGAESLDALGRRPDLLVGDFDSISPALAERLEAAGTEMARHPADKERYDTAQALEKAAEHGESTIVRLDAIGG